MIYDHPIEYTPYENLDNGPILYFSKRYDKRGKYIKWLDILNLDNYYIYKA